MSEKPQLVLLGEHQAMQSIDRLIRFAMTNPDEAMRLMNTRAQEGPAYPDTYAIVYAERSRPR